MPDIVYQLHDPYPVPRDLPVNRRWARVLCGNYAGAVSELTAITRYIYQHIMVEPQHTEIAASLRSMAVVEMHHLDLLGGCIRQLGLTPKYRSFHGGKPRGWSAGGLVYGDGLRDMLELDIDGEQRAIEGYRSSIRQIPEPQIRALLERIMREEELHIQILSSMLRSL